MRFIKVPKLDKYQHYKDRRPPWMKLHAELLQDYDFSLLTDAEKYQLIALWLLATQLDNKLPYDEKWLCNKIQSTKINLSKFIKLGMLMQHDSNVLAECTQSALVEAEAYKEETEVEADKKAAPKKPKVTVATPPPNNFEITNKLTEWSKEKQHHINLATETEKFLNYNRMKGNKCKCWVSAWRNWILKAEGFYLKDNPKPANGAEYREFGA